MYLTRVICVIGTIFSFCDCARILAVVPTPSYSHQVAYRRIWTELSLRGHQVTLLTTDPINDSSLTNLTEIDLSYSYQIWNEVILEATTTNMLKSVWLMINIFDSINHYQLSHPLVQNIITNNSEHYDLAMVEFTGLPQFAFGWKFKCPLIIVSSMDLMSFYSEMLGNPHHPIVYPDQFVPEAETLLDRLKIILFQGMMYLIQILYTRPKQEVILRKYFGPASPPLNEILYNTSMMFINSDPVFHKVRPLVPGIIQIGAGLHRTPSKPLPKDLQDVLDSAKDGFIYFSLGSNVKSKDLTDKTRAVILETFSELPYKVLWKFEAENLLDTPDNLITSKWLPQQDVLKHPNIKLFITQGGLQSLDEAIYDHVPLLCMPFFGDQLFNSKKLVKTGLGLSIDYGTLNKEEFKEKIIEVISNPKYKNRVKELAELALDQPMTGLEKAVWWTEYVIRHKGAKHLRSPLLDIPTYQYYILDVIAVFSIVILVIISLFIALIRCVAKLVQRKPKIKEN